jgi:hypothetical protein
MEKTKEMNRLYRKIHCLVTEFDHVPEYTRFELTDDIFRLAVDFAKRQDRN